MLVSLLPQYDNSDRIAFAEKDSRLLIVMAIYTHRGNTKYYVSKPTSNHPLPIESDRLKVIDDTLPSDWLSMEYKGSDGYMTTAKSFPEWIQDEYFYNDLVDDEHPNHKKVSECYQKHLKAYVQMHREYFPDIDGSGQ